jgi:hypothetical protein
MKPIVLALVGLLLASGFWQAPSMAQTHEPAPRADGEFKGLVLDPEEARIVGAKITLENKRYRFETESNDEGAFQIKVPGGQYSLRIESNGFRSYTRKLVRIEADKTATLSATLWPAPIIDVIRIK